MATHTHDCRIDVHDHYLVYVVRNGDAQPGLYLADGVTKLQAAELLEMMAAKMREEAGS